MRSCRQCRHQKPPHEFARLSILLAVVEKNFSSGSCRICSPRRSSTVAPNAISIGARSPIGEPLAMLPPTVPQART